MIFLTKNLFYVLIVKVSKKFYKKDVQNLVSKQIIVRWQAILSVFYFEIEFIKGSSNVLLNFTKEPNVMLKT